MSLPNGYTTGPLSEDEFKFVETSEMQEAADGGYKVKVERLVINGKTFARVSYQA